MRLFLVFVGISFFSLNSYIGSVAVAQDSPEVSCMQYGKKSKTERVFPVLPSKKQMFLDAGFIERTCGGSVKKTEGRVKKKQMLNDFCARATDAKHKPRQDYYIAKYKLTPKQICEAVNEWADQAG